MFGPIESVAHNLDLAPSFVYLDRNFNIRNRKHFNYCQMAFLWLATYKIIIKCVSFRNRSVQLHYVIILHIFMSRNKIIRGSFNCRPTQFQETNFFRLQFT